ncbi:hypothetical protein CAPTEDRAFT_223054 [Capitella teleta]|uniref:ETS domain-containing protein n=1 Tax=Capitella teleta TaxID=283909 RepID=R7TVM3_CAPTE|nr:hypothetical protein CAPTEDRAFT_223054 [Capitella teleta]|eukprot:ELT97933.1 hypothetical protein CAPTEDRAFT_223054 [Capitella teleta]
MSKRSAEDDLLVDSDDAKRFCPDQQIIDSSGHTLIIRDSTTGEEVATIIQSEDGEVTYDTSQVEDGQQMTIHIAEDVMQDQGELGEVKDPNQHVTIVSENGEAVSFGETVEVPVTDSGVVLSEVGEVGGEMVMTDPSAVGDVQLEAVEGVELEEGQFQNLIIQHMDIEEPLSMLRKLLEARLQCTLDDHEFYLQDAIPLDPNKNLVSQCVEGTGMVQINVEVKSQPGVRPRLNIVDILKPADEVLEIDNFQQGEHLDLKLGLTFKLMFSDPAEPSPPSPPKQAAPQTKVVIPFPEESENVTRWVVDQNFRKEQERLKIPFDPSQWNTTHVRHWIQWAIKEFKLMGVNPMQFQSMNGHQLCDLKHEDFIKLIPHDTNDVFWTHLELLRKCKFVGNNGQIQLWQFLLELLTDKEFQEIIHWVGDEGEFKLNNPEMVAQLWGQRKNKPTMNYEKLSRALRYYYDGDMIAKVHGKRFVYKFVCDLRMLLGYTAGELHRLVRESSEAHLQKKLLSRKFYKVQ